MIQHEDSDEDDCEGYFLRPVNEYNITEKVRQANQELFETSPHPGTPINSPLPPSSSSSSVTTSFEQQQQPRVTFRQILVDYEPEFSSSDEEEYQPEDDTTTITTTPSPSPHPPQIELEGQIIEEQIFIETAIIIPPSAEETETPSDAIPQMDEIQEEIDEVVATIDEEVPPNSDYDDDDDDDNDESNQDRERINLRALYEAQSTTTDSKDCDSVIEVISTLNINSDSANFTGIATIKLNEEKSPPSTSSSAKSLQLNLNFRPCCDYKVETEEQLPRYNGYYSQYGLSKKEIETRERRLHAYRMKQFEKRLKDMESTVEQREKNEEAFANWLKNKMRNPRNRTRNMFDFKGKKKRGKSK